MSNDEKGEPVLFRITHVGPAVHEADPDPERVAATERASDLAREIQSLADRLEAAVRHPGVAQTPRTWIQDDLARLREIARSSTTGGAAKILTRVHAALNRAGVPGTRSEADSRVDALAGRAVAERSLAIQSGVPGSRGGKTAAAFKSLLATLESEIVEAGEACTANYQTMVDWDVITRCVERVKAAVRAWAEADASRDLADEILQLADQSQAPRRFEAWWPNGDRATATQQPGSWHVYDDRYGDLVADVDPGIPGEDAAREVARISADGGFWCGATGVAIEGRRP